MAAKWQQFVHEEEVRKALSVLKPDHQLFEIRILKDNGNRKDVISGYFKDPDVFFEKLESIDLRGANIYFSLGFLKEDLYSRAQRDALRKSAQTTSDSEVDGYQWFFIDVDPVRLAGVSSSKEELELAEKTAKAVSTYLHELGFEEPVKAYSGNGCHLLYRVAMDNTKENVALVERCLKALAMLFDTEKVKIDTTNYNPARICKLYGTLAQKGTNNDVRPYRFSQIVSAPEEIKTTPRDCLVGLSEETGLQEVDISASRPSPGRQRFDLEEWLQRYGLTYKKREGDRSLIYALDECPFDPNHRNGDSKIFLYDNGAVAFKCHHNSCRQYRWQDVRKKYEPDAYSEEDSDTKYDIGWAKHADIIKTTVSNGIVEPIKKGLAKVKIRKLKKASALLEKDIPEPKVFVGMDNDLPLLVEGTCILSAKPKLGKSWLALNLCLAVASGKDFLGYKTRKCSTLYLDLETSEAIQKKRVVNMLAGEECPPNFYLETDTNPIENGFTEQIEAYLKEDPDIGLVVIDVFQIIRSPSKNFKESEYAHAYRDITPLNELAQKHHISIILVCHDRKAVDPEDPFSNILGSTGLQGAASQMIVMFKKNKDDPIHISVKGKTIDGLIDFNVQLDNYKWSIVDSVDSADREKAALRTEYLESPIREAVVKIVQDQGVWKGRCGQLIQEAVCYDVPITDQPKYVGGFFSRHVGHFFQEDGIRMRRIQTGTASYIYEFSKSTIHTIHENEGTTIHGFYESDDFNVPETWPS